MSRNKKIIIAVLALLVLIAVGRRIRVVVAPLDGARPSPSRPSARATSRPIVSASGKIQPKRFVNISADTSGRVVDLAVNEGDRVDAGSVPDANRSANACARASRAAQAALQANQAGARAGAAGASRPRACS